MSALRSKIFTDADPLTIQRLENCALGRPNEVMSHISVKQPNERSEHVRRVQQALATALSADPKLQAAMAREKVPPIVIDGNYSPLFAKAVEVYKRERKILNFRNAIDNIVGIKTIRMLDQENQSPQPLFIPPEPPKPDPDLPDPLLPPPSAGFRLSGWETTGIAGFSGTIPTPIPGLSAGAGVQILTLENKSRKQTATYSLDGLVASFGDDLTKRFPFLKPLIRGLMARLRGRGGSIGPSSFPTFGTEILVTPWVKEPVEAAEFASSWPSRRWVPASDRPAPVT